MLRNKGIGSGLGALRTQVLIPGPGTPCEMGQPKKKCNAKQEDKSSKKKKKRDKKGVPVLAQWKQI